MKHLILILSCISFILGCSNTELKKNNKPGITVSILPQKFFIEQITGDDFNVNVMIPEGYSPAVYEPSPEQLKKLSDSKIYFKIGFLPFELRYIEQFKDINPNIKIIDTSENIELIFSKHHHNSDNSEKHTKQIYKQTQPEHKNFNVDPHIWVSPKCVKQIIENMYSSIIKIYPEKTNIYNENKTKFLNKIELLHNKLINRFSKLKHKKFLVFHPAWSYLARDYGLEQIAIEKQGKSPGPKLLKEVIDIINKYNIKYIIVQKEFNTSIAKSISKTVNVKIIELNPLAYNWIDNLKIIINKFGNILN